MPKWQVGLSHAVHAGFYLIMIGLPLSGWAMASLSPRNLPTVLYGFIPWPHLAPLHDLPPAGRKIWDHWAGQTHEKLAWLTYGLIVLHVAAALKHQFIDRDNLLSRMAPILDRLFPKMASDAR